MECDFCGASNRTMYDGKTKSGPWATMCETHFKRHGVGLGTGKGQQYLHEQTKGYRKVAG